MIPGLFLARLTKFQGIVSSIDFWFPRRLQELHSVLLGLPKKILFYTGMIVSTSQSFTKVLRVLSFVTFSCMHVLQGMAAIAGRACLSKSPAHRRSDRGHRRVERNDEVHGTLHRLHDVAR